MNDEVEVTATSRRAELIATLIDLGLKVISSRLIMIFTLLLDTGIFAWAMFADSWMRLASATIFAIASWCIVYLRPKGEK